MTENTNILGRAPKKSVPRSAVLQDAHCDAVKGARLDVDGWIAKVTKATTQPIVEIDKNSHARPSRQMAEKAKTVTLAAQHEELSATHQINLMERLAQHGDKAAFKQLFQHFAPRIKAYLMRSGSDPISAEEITQDALMSVWRRCDSFDAGQASVSTWIFTIARNRRIDLYRRGNKPKLDPNDPALVPAAEDAPDDAVEAQEQANRLRQAVGLLPETQSSLLRMAFFEEKPHSEIATETGLPLGTVKSRLRLAIQKLRTTMEGLD